MKYKTIAEMPIAGQSGFGSKWIQLLLALTGMITAGLAGAECVDYRAFPSLGEVDISGDAAALVAGDGYFVASARAAGVHVIVVDPTGMPQVVASVDTPGDARSAAVTGRLVAVADGDSGLVVIDMTDPWHPQLMGSLPDPVGAVVATGTAGIVAGIAYGSISLYDISDANNPVVVGHVARTEGLVFGDQIASSGNDVYAFAYLYADPDGDPRIVRIDVATPAAPTIVGAVRCGWATSLLASGTDVFMTTSVRYTDYIYEDQIYKYEFGGSNPRMVRVIPCEWGQRLLAANADYLYSASTQFAAFRTSDLARVRMRDGLQNMQGVAFDGERIIALVRNPSRVLVLDARDTGALPIVSALTLTARSRELVAAGSTVLATTETQRVAVIDLGDVNEPRLCVSLPLPCASGRIAADGALAVVALGTCGIALLDIENPDTATLASVIPTRGAATQAVVQGNLVFVADAAAGLTIVDALDPSHPVVIGSLSTMFSVEQVQVHGSIAFIRHGPYAVMMVDVSDPRNPIARGSLPGGFDEIRFMAMSGSRLYVSSSFIVNEILWVYDITDPVLPVAIGRYYYGSAFTDLVEHDGYAYAVDTWGTMHILTPLDGAAPVSTATSPIIEGGQRLAASTNGLVSSRGTSMIVVPYHCDPTTPTFLRSFEATRVAGGVMIRWQVAPGATDRDFRLFRHETGIDVGIPYRQSGDPDSYVAEDYLPWRDASVSAGYELQLRLSGDGWVTVSSATVMGESARGGTLAVAASPNPCSSGTELAFRTDRSEFVELAIYDVAGRLVRRLQSGNLDIGDHRFAWNGRDEHGRPASAGTYLARLRTLRGLGTVKFELLQ